MRNKDWKLGKEDETVSKYNESFTGSNVFQVIKYTSQHPMDGQNPLEKLTSFAFVGMIFSVFFGGLYIL